MVYLTHCKKAFRNTNYKDIVQWESDCKILHLLHLLCYVIVVPSQAQWFTSTSGIIKFECLGYYRRQRMRSVLHRLFIFVMKSTHQRQHRGAESRADGSIVSCTAWESDA